MKSKNNIVVSHYQMEPLLKIKKEIGNEVDSSRDLGITSEKVTIINEGIQYATGEILDWDLVKKIIKSKTNCFTVDQNGIDKIKTYSSLTKRTYSLMPTETAPTMLVSGVLMHRIKGTDPISDTLQKVKAIEPVKGLVLDTATGLGYTAIEASKTAEHVTTIELDPSAQEMVRMNPWSQNLLDNPKVTQLIGDSFHQVEQFGPESFHRIIHDPPVISLAGDLYSEEFYRKLYHVLKPKGILFHYIGNPASRSVGRVTQGVMSRLKLVGFKRVSGFPSAFGVVARK